MLDNQVVISTTTFFSTKQLLRTVCFCLYKIEYFYMLCLHLRDVYTLIYGCWITNRKRQTAEREKNLRNSMRLRNDDTRSSNHIKPFGDKSNQLGERRSV